MTKAPERAVFHESPHEIEKGFQGWWHIDDGANGTGLGWYVPEDHALALVAAAYEDATEVIAHDYVCDAIRARTPDDATAALKARDQRIRNEALREAVSYLKASFVGGDAIAEAVFALITEGQSDG